MEQPQLPGAHVEPQGAEQRRGQKGKQPVHQAAQPGGSAPKGAEQVKDQSQGRPQAQGGEKAPELRGKVPHPPQSLRNRPPAGRASS